MNDPRYTTIKISHEQKAVLDKMRIHRPDVGPNSYEKSLLVVVADTITKAQKYDEMMKDK